MPHTLQYRPVLIDTLISNERINSYQNVFQPANDVELMGVYLWNTHVCGALYPLIAMVEITLRNAIDQALTPELGHFWWSGARLHHHSHAQTAAPPHPVQAVQDNFVKATRKYIADIRSRHRVRGHVTPSHAGVLAKTEFSTWEYLLDAEFMGRGLIWPRYLSTAFRGTWPARRTSLVLTHVRDLVVTLRAFRNRVFHHEPAWKRYGVTSEIEALRHLHEKIDKIETLLALIHPENIRLLRINGLLRNAHRTCTSDEIRRYQHLARMHEIDSLDTLADLARDCAIKNCAFAARLPLLPNDRLLILPA
ncbi:CAAX protease [Pararobbsia silviterrae]|uniref:CAAX protease n=1 Tax=Pararobbsia silviterrae TaxID=1792498 RepID=A0A494XIQ1_9BURK|nr:CAAX protease [Pararobbsia silviterrae]RKP49601.1 CAAX protease [Pararobbsia silviterrae]